MDGRGVTDQAAAEEADRPQVRRDPNVIARDIEQTRTELAAAIDAIAKRLNPKEAASRGVRAARDAANPAPPVLPLAAVAGLVVVLLLVVRRRRHR
jgi:hypothetical protein